MLIKNKAKTIIQNAWQQSYEHQVDRFIMGSMMLDLKRSNGGVWNNTEFSPDHWDEFGFQVFSQANEDGLIQYLISKINISSRTFIEFGVGDYNESNTRFLLMNNRWRGLVMDGSTKNMDNLRNSWLYWKHDIKAVDVFITRNNINDIIENSGFGGDIGLLSIDIDGNDYWVWKAIDCINPTLVITEYNPLFGCTERVTIPYSNDFRREKAHYSNMYAGMSIAAAGSLAKEKGYKLVCVDQMGHNAFWVKRDIANTLGECSVEDAYRPLAFRESRSRDGQLSYLSAQECLKLIEDCIIVDLKDGKEKKVKEIYNV